MENGFKRFLSLAMAILMVVSNIPTAAFASEVEGECLHTSVQINSTATCTEAGETITSCLLCEEILSAVEAEATGHNYVDGVCENCEEADPDAVMVVQDDAPVLDAEPEEEGEPEEEPEEEPEQGVIEEETPALGNEGETEGEPEGTPVPCTLSEGCTKEAGHDGDCVTGEPEVVEEVAYVAMVDEQGYETLSAAIAAAEAGDTITFVADITEDVTVNKDLTIDGAGKTYTGKMNLKADTTIQNVNFDGKGYNGYAVETRGADYLTIEDCTAKNYGYGFVQLASATTLTTVKNVTVSDVNYGVKVDYSNAVVLENVKIDAAEAAVLNSNYGEKTITIKDSKLSILGTWTRNDTIKSTYVFEGENTIDEFVIDAALDTFKLAEGATLTAPNEITVTTDVADHVVKHIDGKYTVVEDKVYVAQIGEQGYETLAAAIAAAEAGDTITFVADITENVTVNKSVTIDGAGETYTGQMKMTNKANVTVKNVNFDGKGYNGYAVETRGANYLTIEDCTAKNYGYGFVQLVSGTVLTTVKNVTVSDVNYGVKTDYSNAVVLENVDITAAVAAVLNSNYGEKTITISNSDISILGTWTRNDTIKSTYVFEGENTIDEFVIDEALDTFKLAEGATLTAPNEITVTTDVADHVVKYIDGKFTVVEDKVYVAQIGEQGYETLTAAIAAAEAGDTITFVADITEDVTVNKSVTIDGAGKTYTGQMKMTNKANVTVKNVNFDGKGYNGYAVETRGANYLTIEDCTAKNYGYGFVQLVSGNVLVTVKNVTVSDVNYGVKTDYSGAVVLENVKIDAAVAAVLNSNYGEKTITIKNSELSILGTWTRNNTIKSTYVFEGANIIDKFVVDAAIDNFKLAAGATLTAPNDITVTTDVDDHEVGYNNGVYEVVPIVRVAKIGETEYRTLSAAIAAAQAGDTITFLTDITEDVTVSKSVTIDGAEKTYTGNISVKGSTVDATVKNVNFVGGTGYAITTNTIKSITVENCTVKDYNNFGFLYANKSTPTVVVKDVTVDNCYYGFHYVYGTTATLENVKMTNVETGLYIQNYAGKTINLKDCEISSTYIWERSGYSGVQTFNFEGQNTVGTLSDSQYAKYVLTAEKATLSAPEGATVATTVADREVAHIDGVYKVVPIVRVTKIGETEYRTLAAAIAAAKAGDTITFLTDITENVTVSKSVTIDGANFNYTGNISVEGTTVDAIVKNVNFVDGTGYAITTNRIKSITVENCTVKDYENFGFLYANKSTPTVVVKDVTVDNCYYGFHYVYGSTATLENVTMTDVETGLYIQNYAGKTINLKDCEISSTYIWERSGYSGVQTFNFEGQNTVGTLSDSQYAKYVLTDEDATLSAPEGATVTTTVADREVARIDGVYKVVPIVRVAKIGETEYRTLSAAIAAAKAGDTITFLTDIAEDVTVNKDLTIDGAGKSYTGNISVKGSTVDATVKNVNFVGGTGYAITTNTIKSITVENCTAKGYGYGFLYANKSTPAVVVKNVTVENCNYGFRWVYGSTATLENVTMTDVVYGLDIQNYAAKTINLKNCDISSIAVQERENASAVQTFNFEGANTVGTLYAGQYAKYILTAEKATLTAPEDATVTTTVADREVAHIDGVYKVVPIVRVAKIGETEYRTLSAAIAAAQAGDTITFLTDITEDVTVNKDLTIDGAGKSYTGNISVKGSTVDATVKNVNFVGGTGYAITTNTIKSITVENCTAENYGYGFLYANKSTPTVVVKNVTVENCNYGFRWVYGSTATLENVTMTDVMYGLDIQNYAAKTIDLKNCTISSIAVQERENASAVQTFNFEGANTVGTLYAGQYAKYILTAEDATLTAPEGVTVTTTVADREVERIEGVYKVVPIVRVAQIGETQYKTLAAAIEAAEAGDTITFLTDITEDVTVNKDLTIDGANFNYTGNISVEGSAVDATIKNVNFVNGTGYAITTNRIKSITVENCTAKGYGYGFLYANKSTPTVVVKDVTVENCNYGFHYVYGTTATLENVKMTNVTNGIMTQNYGAKTITIRNCDISATKAIHVWKRNATVVDTFIFEGENTLSNLTESAQAKLILTADAEKTEEAILTTPQVEGLNITSGVADYKVVYETDAYKLVKMNYVAQIGEAKFETLAEAFNAAKDGDTITMIADHVMDGSKATTDKIYGYDNLIVNGKSITLDFAGYTVEVTPNCVDDNGGIAGTLESIVFLTNGATLTLKDETGKGGFCVMAGTDLYSLIYNNGSTLVIESGNYYVEKTIIKGSIIYADKAQKTTINGGVFTLLNAAEDTDSTKPWIVNVEGKNESFVNINGGYFNDNPYKNYGTQKDCEVEIPDAKVFKQLTEGEYEGYWGLVNAVAWNVNTTVTYSTLDEALAAAKAGETVELLANVEVNIVMVPANVKLDLHGKTLKANYAIVSFGDVIDSTDGAGGIAISADAAQGRTSLMADNEYFPIYDSANSCYRFFNGVKNFIRTRGFNKSGTAGAKAGFTIMFNSANAYELMAADNSGVVVNIYLIWGDMTEPAVFTVPASLVDAYIEAALSQNPSETTEVTKVLTFSVTGLDTLKEGTVVTCYAGLNSVGTGASRITETRSITVS